MDRTTLYALLPMLPGFPTSTTSPEAGFTIRPSVNVCVPVFGGYRDDG